MKKEKKKIVLTDGDMGSSREGTLEVDTESAGLTLELRRRTLVLPELSLAPEPKFIEPRARKPRDWVRDSSSILAMGLVALGMSPGVQTFHEPLELDLAREGQIMPHRC
ncbi:hypothetical protein CRG98_016126 [Punica granatum]|uniref:Uncharacterized protein n=1 Tax=Punica granatum TaxID=22663 RepID=A0A2I0K4I2_PUNGR|nr:hypothetical protein CRG98_016126 [Punica granatum]